MKRLSAVLFDLDGTLVDTAPDMVAAANELRKLQGLGALPFERLRGQVSRGAIGLITAALDRHPDDPDFERLRMDFLALYGERNHEQSEMFPGMDEVLQNLDRWDIRWGIVTNKPEAYADPLLNQLGLDERAGTVVTGDALRHRKPHPEPIVHACRELAVKPGSCVYVGDAERDFQASRRAGARGVVALWGYIDGQDQPRDWAAEAWLETPAQLSAWIAQCQGQEHPNQ
ncbi:MAG: phosphoglycolate phosphatase [Gammaproteobacteria bacterium]|nr:MAG: phosphoglycolate phosphatase [Gammaproteobacteria bacterium]